VSEPKESEVVGEKDVVDSPGLFLEEWTPEQFWTKGMSRGHFEWTRHRCELAAAAPAMVRVLVEAEFDQQNACVSCMRFAIRPLVREHVVDCPLDDALTAAGLPDQASRDKLRELIEERSG
jgi:hypothetical protein